VLFGTDMNKVGQILEVEKKVDDGGKGSQVVSIKGKQAKIIFSQRVVDPGTVANYTSTGAAETVMKAVVTAQAGTGAISSRQMPILVVPATAGLGASYTYTSRYKQLDKDLSEISKATGLGFNLQLDLSAKKLNFVVIPGVNRVASQSTNGRVIISTDFDSLKTGSIKDSYVSYKNLVYAAGQGVGEARNVRKTYSGTEPTGLARRESFADMRDLSSNTDIDARAASVLGANGTTKFVDAEALSYSQYVLGTDYNLGDFITVSAYGDSNDVQITSIKESWAPSNYDISMGFNKSYPEAPKVQAENEQATRQAVNNSEQGNGEVSVTTNAGTVVAINIKGDQNKERVSIESQVPVFQASKHNGTIAAKTAVLSGDSLGFFQAGGYDGTSASFNLARMIAVATENWSSSAHGVRLAFQTCPNGGAAGIERMSIGQDGVVSFPYDISAGDWTSYTPTVTAGTGSITSYASSGKYKKFNKVCIFTALAQITNNGTGGSYVGIQLPLANAGNALVFAGRENQATGYMVQGYVPASGTIITCYRYDNAYPGGTNYTIIISGSYEVA